MISDELEESIDVDVFLFESFWQIWHIKKQNTYYVLVIHCDLSKTF